MSKIHRPPISIARIIRFMKKKERHGRIAVVVGTITDDKRIWTLPKMTVSICFFYIMECSFPMWCLKLKVVSYIYVKYSINILYLSFMLDLYE